ncbi:MAG: chemotaxis protein CheW [Magnetovibrio sp.]|nr:chemotaxis protein CheW [Magnetovibrio sp.]
MAQDLVTTDNSELVEAEDQSVKDFVTFMVGNQLFGISILLVQDILHLEKIAPIPLAPPEIKGSVNIRGRIVTVVSVRICLGLTEQEEKVEGDRGSNMGVTIEQNGNLYTLLVDSIGDVVSPSPNSYESNPGTLDPVWRQFANGVYRLEGRLMVALDVDRVLAIKPK